MDTLIIRPAALGDTLMLLPSLVQLRHGAAVTLAGRIPGINFLRPYVRRCVDFESSGWHSLFMEHPDVPSLPRAEIVVAFLRDAGNPLKENLQKLFPSSRVYVFPGLPAEGDGVHAALHLARCLEAAGLLTDAERCVREAESRPLVQNGAHGKGETILFHPGSGGRAKNHPPDFWLSLMRTMGEEPSFRGFRQRVLLGPAEESVRPCYTAALNGDREVILSPEADDLLHLLGESTLYLGQDSGVTHLAAMMGVPTVALFRVDNTSMWRPLGPRVAVVRDRESGKNLASAVLEEAARILGGA